jgi:5-methylcytosine-specific restriction protein A
MLTRGAVQKFGATPVKSFLVTLKPATEAPEHGWPLEELQKIVSRHRAGERVEDDWRFHNRKDVSIGDRVFLLLQGRLGPAVIGYGTIVGLPDNDGGTWAASIQFESLVDPATEVLANREDLQAIAGGASVWRTRRSGIQLQQSIASDLEKLVVGTLPKPRSEEPDSNPDWTRDELIIALHFYLQHRPNPPGKGSSEIIELSKVLNRLGEKLFSPEDRADTFRNENGVYMKLMNLRRFDPQYTSEGKSGLSRGSKAEEEVWAEFAGDAERCRHVAEAIMASLDDPEIGTDWLGTNIGDEGVQEAAEGRLLTRRHLARERNRKLVESKRNQAMKRYGKLVCAVCDFDFAVHYGDRGSGFIECHHTKPVATLAEGHKTHIDDLALVCSNCHRIIHRHRPWLSVIDLKDLMNRVRLHERDTT